jgi:hypothetical protein
MLIEDPNTSEISAFEPETIKVMHKAYTEVCVALHVVAGDRSGREAIATRVIDLAKTGVIDAGALRDRVLLEAQLTV